MKKGTVIVLVAILAALTTITVIVTLESKVFATTQQAEADYTNIDIYKLEKIKNDSKALSQVRNINLVSYTKENNQKFEKYLELVKLCPNVEYLYICANGLKLDKTFLNSIKSTNGVSISIQWSDVDFAGVNNSNITTLYLSENTVYNFSSLINLTNLKTLVTDAVDGFYVIDFNKLSKLEDLRLTGQRIESYKDFFTKIKYVKTLGLSNCNLQNSDTRYMKEASSIESLSLEGTFVSDITFLKNLPNLSGVSLPFGVDNLDVLYEMPYLNWVTFDAYTETNVDNNLVNFFESNNISYPNFDRGIKSKVEEIVKSFGFTKNTTEYEKIEKVTEYVLKNMKSNQDKLNEINLSNKSGKETSLDLDINYGYGVCHYYSILEYTLLKKAGIDAYYVSGYALFEDGARGSHAWNMVRVDGSWYGIDALWLDDDNNDPTTPQYKNSVWRRYYLKPTKIDDLNYWPKQDEQAKYIDRYFALQHRTFNDPQDTIKGNVSIKYISVTTLPTKIIYIKEEQLDLTGGILIVTYSDNTTDTISLTNENVHISGFDSTKVGTNSITVEYMGLTAKFDVQIVSKQIIGIEMLKVPTKTKYIQNHEKLDLTGGVLKVLYSDKSTENIDITNENVEVSGFDNTKLGTNKIGIKYNNFTTSFDVEIISKIVTKIELTTALLKTRYIKDLEELDLTGGILTVTYDDGTTDTISLKNEGIKVEGFNNKKLGINTITVEYENAMASFNIEIIPNKNGLQKTEKIAIIIGCIVVSTVVMVVIYKKNKK